MNTLKITYECTNNSYPDDIMTFTQTIGDIPDNTISGIKSRINTINASISSVGPAINLDTATTTQKYAAAIKYVLAGCKQQPGAIEPQMIYYTVRKITDAELIVQETTNIYNYAQIGV